MKVPFSNLTRDEYETIIEGESVGSRILRNIQDVISRKNFILGDYVDTFEKDFAKYCRTNHCISVGNGFSALELSLIACGIGRGMEVMAPANTFNATVGAIVKTGAKPVLIDVSDENYNIDISEIKKSINSKTKAVIPVHLYGQTAEMIALKDICDSKNIPIIEDACQAHGAFYNEKRAGNLGKIAAFSFYPGKNLGGYGDGGAITTNSDEYASLLKKVRNYGQTKKYCHDVKADNSRLDTIQAAVLVEKLRVLDKWNVMRIKNAEIYREKLQYVKEIKLPIEREKGEHVYHLFVIQAEKRDELSKYLEERGIQTGLHYPVSIHMQQCFSKLGYVEGDFPVTERLSKNILTLPMFPTLKVEEINYVAKGIKEFYSK
jgi:dTDP-4-amino-4,6-dideoxygalactose transaminase